MPMLVLASLIPHRFEHFLQHYGWLALFVLVFLQDVGIPTAVPGTVLVLFGGYLVFTGALNLHVAALSLAAGAFIGASAMFLLAQYGGRPLVLKLGRFIGLTEARLDSAARSLERWGPPMLLITRVAPGTRVYMTLFAGISGWTYRRFALWTGVFVLLWAYTFVIIGDALGNRWETIARFIIKFGGVLVILVVALVVAYALNIYLTNRRNRLAGGALMVQAEGVGMPVILAVAAPAVLPAATPTDEQADLPNEGTLPEAGEAKPTSLSAIPASRSRSAPAQPSSKKRKKREQRHAHSRPRR